MNREKDESAIQKVIPPNKKLSLQLTKAERQMVLDLYPPEELEGPILKTEPGQPIFFTLDDLNELGG